MKPFGFWNSDSTNAKYRTNLDPGVNSLPGAFPLAPTLLSQVHADWPICCTCVQSSNHDASLTEGCTLQEEQRLWMTSSVAHDLHISSQ